MKRILTLFVAVLVALAFVAGVSAQSKPKIGYITKMPEEPWFQTEAKGSVKAGADLGFSSIYIGASDGEKVLAGIDNLAAQGAKGFVICTPDTKLGPAIMAKAKNLGLKVITVDDQFVKADGTPMVDVPHLGMSGTAIGKQVGEVMSAELKKRNWKAAETGAIAVTSSELATAVERVEGTKSVLIKNGFPEDKIFESPQRTTDVEGGFNAANPVITNHPEIKNWLVFSLNDDTTLGVVRALEGRGFTVANTLAVGIGGQQQVIDEFRKAKPNGFFASIFVGAFAHGYQTSKMMYEWLTKDKLPPANTATSGIMMDRNNYKKVYADNGMGVLK